GGDGGNGGSAAEVVEGVAPAGWMAIAGNGGDAGASLLNGVPLTTPQVTTPPTLAQVEDLLLYCGIPPTATPWGLDGDTGVPPAGHGGNGGDACMRSYAPQGADGLCTGATSGEGGDGSLNSHAVARAGNGGKGGDGQGGGGGVGGSAIAWAKSERGGHACPGTITGGTGGIGGDSVAEASAGKGGEGGKGATNGGTGGAG